MAKNQIVKWTNEIQTIAEYHSNIKYHRVDDSKTNPSEWKNLKNVDCISYHELESILDETILRTK